MYFASSDTLSNLLAFNLNTKYIHHNVLLDANYIQLDVFCIEGGTLHFFQLNLRREIGCCLHTSSGLLQLSGA